MKQETEIKLIESLARLEANQEAMKEDIDLIKKEDAEQNKLLAEHIAGVKSAHKRIDQEKESWDKMFEQVSTRLEVVEFVPKTLNGMWTIIKWLGVLSGSLAAITKLLNMW
jgi:predicted nuclease with TOPRIM domain